MFKLSGIVVRSSECADSIIADVINGTCRVAFTNGKVYDYTNVSRRALFSLLNDESISLGFFVRNHLLFCDSKCAKYGNYKLAYSYAV